MNDLKDHFDKELTDKEKHIPFDPSDDGDRQYWKNRFRIASKEIDQLNKQLATALKSMDKLIKQLAVLENSKLVKMRKYFYLYLGRLRSKVSKGKKRSIGSVLYNYVFKRGG